MPPYDILRKFFSTFGLGEMGMQEYAARMAKREQGERADDDNGTPKTRDINMIAMRALPVIELSRVSPGMVTALGVSVGLTANAIMSRGTKEQIEKYVPDVLTLKKIGAWAITEPGAGSDAFGSMRATARRDDDYFVINGSKTFITNGPYADTIVFICKLDDGEEMADRRVISFILDGDMEGLVRSKPLRKMGLHSSPTGELFADDLRVHKDRLIGGEGALTRSMRSDAKSTFGQERTGILAMALGMIERAQEMSVEYAKTRVQFGKPIGQRQLIQLKLAKMEVARQNVQNLLFRTFEMAAAGKSPTLAEASAGKLYAAQVTMDVCLEAVQVFGGNGYMAEFRIEQLARDAKCLQIYGGTDEIQVSQIARDLLKD
jgi:alkylation response protein AidB-like acyl-CoA dehydrogenase